jgi:hypothetical protein
MHTVSANVTESQLADGSFQVVWKEGYLQFKRLARGIVFMRKVGDFNEDVFQSIIKPFNTEWNHTKELKVVCDAAEMGAYTAAYRRLWTDWFRARSGHVKIYIYTPSKLIRMAVAVVNMVVDVFEVCSNEQSLHTILTRLVPSFQPAMLPARLVR